VGRFRDGTAIALESRQTGRRENNFTYHADPDGNKCPLFSHVRKSNPRGSSLERPETERAHRIARRGMTYGEFTPFDSHESSWPERGVGLLFQCYQASVPNQFEFIQLQWANSVNVSQPGTGQDTVIGQGASTTVRVPARWGHADRVSFDFGEFVRMLGGEYFFTPSIPVLRRI
jgi:deferrochelatase/peroxidase EfeB